MTEVMALFRHQFDEMELYRRQGDLIAAPERSLPQQAELVLVTALLAGSVTEYLLAGEAELNGIPLDVMAGVWQQYCAQAAV